VTPFRRPSSFNPYVHRSSPVPSPTLPSIPWTEALPDVEVAPDGTDDGKRDAHVQIVSQTFVRPQRLHVFSAKRAGVLRCEWCGAPRERVRRVCEFCGKRVHHAYRAAAHDLLVVQVAIGSEYLLMRPLAASFFRGAGAAKIAFPVAPPCLCIEVVYRNVSPEPISVRSGFTGVRLP
jgi:hypothetical protein